MARTLQQVDDALTALQATVSTQQDQISSLINQRQLHDAHLLKLDHQTTNLNIRVTDIETGLGQDHLPAFPTS